MTSECKLLGEISSVENTVAGKRSGLVWFAAAEMADLTCSVYGCVFQRNANLIAYILAFSADLPKLHYFYRHHEGKQSLFTYLLDVLISKECIRYHNQLAIGNVGYIS